MNVLGIHTGHDAAICIIKDGKLISAITAERITKRKKEWILSKEIFDYVFQHSGLTINDIDYVAMSDFHSIRTKEYCYLTDGVGKITTTSQILEGNEIREFTFVIEGKSIPAYVIPHHLSHCASAYYTSNMDESWCFSLDASGGKVQFNSLIAKGSGNKLTAIFNPMLMVGWAYSGFTYRLGIGDPMYKAGSTMGLASYGKPHPYVVDNIDKYVESCYFKHGDDENQYQKHFLNIFEIVAKTKEVFSSKQSYSKKAMNGAATIQFLFEEAILNTINNLIEKDATENICLSGGSFLNCIVNTRIKNETRFKNLHLFPACTDDGIAIGAALYVAHHILDEPRHKYKTGELCYLGQTYGEVKEPDYKKIANMIADGKIIAWFMEGSEYGPRALGHRSILADPRVASNKEIMNFVIKNREWYRPIAPAVLEEESSKWFDFEGPSPYMLFAAKVLQPEKIPAITHVDGTARMQTVNEETNKHFYKLIKEFYKITGIPMVINTSLNGDGQPILETKTDARKFFNENEGIDALVLNGELIVKVDK